MTPEIVEIICVTVMAVSFMAFVTIVIYLVR